MKSGHAAGRKEGGGGQERADGRGRHRVEQLTAQLTRAGSDLRVHTSTTQQGRAEQSRAEQSRAEQSRAGHGDAVVDRKVTNRLTHSDCAPAPGVQARVSCRG
ncbi:hypothetical protein P280DRAFT_25177 [Massarina eburnea CBS 473.64]|uniref:Uncharacterized protein n=1 Tax=Massarina eburnea CBS 473.64 TaxID=1395130 RepID=A0A6A6RXZ4_9PLEO|nr:hypothetical protein P280DRAFT_25177 [Massarina eburnea CBS 473.64]